MCANWRRGCHEAGYLRSESAARVGGDPSRAKRDPGSRGPELEPARHEPRAEPAAMDAEGSAFRSNAGGDDADPAGRTACTTGQEGAGRAATRIGARDIRPVSRRAAVH